MAKRRAIIGYVALVILAVAGAGTSAARAEESLEAEARRMGKGVLVLQVGSDWCVAGERMRKAFESEEFRKLAGDEFVLGVYDEMENPTPETLKANERVKGLVKHTKWYPRIVVYLPSMKFVGAWNYFPQGWNAAELYVNVSKLVYERGLRTEADFKKAAAAQGEEAADLYGQGFYRLIGRLNKTVVKEFLTGEYGWGKEWEALCKLDADDKYGWVMHIQMDTQEAIKMVAKVTELKAKSREEAKAYVEKVRAKSKHFTPDQQQCVKIMEYALDMDGLDKPLTLAQKKLLQDVLALNDSNFWGNFARGRLIMDGEQIASPEWTKLEMVPRPDKPAEPVPFLLDRSRAAIKGIKPNAKLSESQKLEIARYAALRLIGEEGWQKLVSRPGSENFVRAFLDDRTWLEDFAWNGLFPTTGYHRKESCEPGAGAGAILALESLVFQDNGQWVKFQDGKFEDNEGRRFMTALALNYPDQSEQWLARELKDYRTTAQAGMLHKSAYSQPVWLWRMALNLYYFGNVAGQQMCMDVFCNVPVREYHKIPWDMQFTGPISCFGGRWTELVQVFRKADETTLVGYTYLMGHASHQRSKLALACANARGVPALMVEQPQGHLAFSYRKPDGTWELGNNLMYPSQMHFCFWPHDKMLRPWQYVSAVESTFGATREARHAADRMLALAKLAWESKRDFATVQKYYRRACTLHPGHYGAWLEYESYLLRANVPLAELGRYANALIKGYKSGGRPLWDLLTPYFKRIGKEQGAESVKQEIRRLEPAIKTPPARLAEASDFSTMCKTWGL